MDTVQSPVGLRFGVSSIPLSTVSPSYLTGLKRIAELKLDAFELPFTRFVNMSEEGANKFNTLRREIANETGKLIEISVHAPYFINLNAAIDEKIEESIQRILKSAERGAIAGATNIVFHPGFYLKSTPEETYKKVSESMNTMLTKYYVNGTTADTLPMLRPETTGKVNQFGTLDELLDIANAFPQTLPCIDFAHLHARSNGQVNSYDDVCKILENITKKVGNRLLHNLHIHYSGIEYTEKGERKHLPLKESDANYKDVLKALKSFDAAGRVICESPIQEEDALLLKETYYSL